MNSIRFGIISLVAITLLSEGTHLEAQTFTELPPVALGGGQAERFPALKDMRSAWGDFNGDGYMDVILMGIGPTGPVVRLYKNLGNGGIVNPFTWLGFALQPVSGTGLPQLKDGAMAWGDMDKDGAVDLAMTGMDATGALHTFVFRNTGPDGNSGSWVFTDVLVGPSFPGCRWGSVSWGDMDNDGDQDLFVSGDLTTDYVEEGWDRVRFSQIHMNIRGNLTSEGPRFLNPYGVKFARDYPEVNLPPEPGRYFGSLTRRVTRMDMNRDGYDDLVLTADDTFATGHDLGPFASSFRQEVWLYRNDSMDYERLGNPTFGEGYGTTVATWLNGGILTDDPFDLWAHTALPGGVGDWDGDGDVDVAFFAGAFEIHNDTTASRLDPPGKGALLQNRGGFEVSDPIPGFMVRETPQYSAVAAQISADVLNLGRQQSLGSMFLPVIQPGSTFYRPPVMKILGDDGNGGLAERVEPDLGIQARFRGVLDAVDADNDGRLDVLHSGFDESGSTVDTRFYRNNGTVNTPPAVPQGLSTEATPFRMHFRWSASTDAQTPQAALRYAIRLKLDGSETWLITSGATESGERLTPGLDNTLQRAEFEFDAYNSGYGRVLADGTYCWSVQAIDSAGQGSAFAPIQCFTIYTGPPPPVDQETGLPWRDTAIDLGDLENDGDLDVVLAGNSKEVSYPFADTTVIARKTGPEQFSTVNPALPSVERGAARWGDVDGDGDLDLALSGNSLGHPITRIFRNDAGVLEVRNLLEGVENSALDWGDFDNDGDLDLIVTGYRDKLPLTRLYRNGGDDNLPADELFEQPTTLPNIGSGAAAWGDYDGDGDLDLLLCGDTQNYNQPPHPCTAPPYHLRPPGAHYMCHDSGQPPPVPVTRLFCNNGLATSGLNARKWQFTEVTTTALPLVVSSFAFQGLSVTARAEWCDLNADGAPDLVLGGLFASPTHPEYATPSVKVFLNAGPGGLGEWLFLPGQQLLDGAVRRSLQTMTCADWDNDGLPDILLSGWLNSAGDVPTQIVHNDSLAFNRRSYLRPLDEGELQFPGGLAAFGHFDGNADADVVLSGRWGIQGTGGLGYSGTVGSLFLNLPAVTNNPPSAPAGLAASVSGTAITLTWQPAGDDHTPAAGLSYNVSVVRTDSQSGGMPGMADLLTGTRRICRTGNVGYHTSWTLRDLPAGTYRWSVQAIDAALATSAFTTAAQTFTASPPLPPVITPLPPLHQWVVGNPAPATVDFLSVASGRNARLVVGRRGEALLSRNRNPFARIETGVFTDLYDVIIDTQGAMIVGEAGVIRTSSDGIIWAASPSGITATLRAVTGGGTGWVAAGDGVVLHSTDRRSWTPGILPAGTVVHDLVWALGRYVAAGEQSGQGLLLTSTDGMAWTDVTPSGLSPGRLTGVATDGVKIVAVGGNPIYPGVHADVLSSTNGSSWTVTQTPNAAPMLKLTHGTGGWFAVTERGILFSSDAMAWAPTFSGGFLQEKFSSVAVDAGLATAAGPGGGLFDSPATPVSWTRRGGNSMNTYGQEPLHIAALGSTLVAVGESGLQHVSRDGGRTWQGSVFLVGDGFYGVAAGAGRIVRSHYRGFDSTTNGIDWQSIVLGSLDHPKMIVFGNGLFVAPRSFGGFFVSTTGLAWNKVGTAIPEAIALAHGNGQFMTLDASGNVRVSTDGSSWSLAGQVTAQRLCFAHDRFFAISSSGLDVRSSTDGVAWQGVAGLPFGAVVSRIVWHRDRFIALGGPNAMLLASPDAVTWSPIPIPASGMLNAALSTDAGLVVAGSGQALLLAPDTAPPAPPPAPATLTITGNPLPNVILLTVSGRAGQVVTLERSRDLSAWTVVETFTLSGGAEVLEVESLVSLSADFFRLRWEP